MRYLFLNSKEASSYSKLKDFVELLRIFQKSISFSRIMVQPVLWIRISMFLGLPDPPITSNKSKKNLNFYYFVTAFYLLSMKTDVNGPSKCHKHKNFEKKKLNFCWHLVSHWRKKQDMDPVPDPSVSGTDPRIRIRTKMSRIHNTDWGQYT